MVEVLPFLGVSNSDKTNKQAILNKLARIACEALSCLAGFRSHTPENDGVQNSLRALLTPYVCRQMKASITDYTVLEEIEETKGRSASTINSNF